jgi:hypothetical protein
MVLLSGVVVAVVEVLNPQLVVVVPAPSPFKPPEAGLEVAPKGAGFTNAPNGVDDAEEQKGVAAEVPNGVDAAPSKRVVVGTLNGVEPVAQLTAPKAPPVVPASNAIEPPNTEPVLTPKAILPTPSTNADGGEAPPKGLAPKELAPVVVPAAPNLLFPSKAGADTASGVGAADPKPKELGPVGAQTKPPVANAGAALVVAANAPPS